MENLEKHIVALDLGSSKIALTVATLNGKDLQVVYHKTKPSAGINYSEVANIRNVSQTVKELVKDAEEELGLTINQAVVGMPKFPIRLVSNEAEIKDRGEDSEITEEDIRGLKMIVQDYKLEDEDHDTIYGCVAQAYSDGECFQYLEEDIIGMMSNEVRGNFKIFIGKKKGLKTIDSALTRAGIATRMKYFTAETTARAVLTPTEMENGVALIDFGGGAASVTVYYGNILRHYASIPFGGKNITNDIKTELQLNEKLAENIKLGFGACMPERLQSMSEKKLHIVSKTGDTKTEVPIKYLSEIITARIEEIIYALLYEINESGTADYIRSGIVITGGVAQTANIATLISDMSGYPTRIGYPSRGVSCQGNDFLRETGSVTSLGLIMAAAEEDAMNCAVYSDNPKSGNIEIEVPQPEPEVEPVPEPEPEPVPEVEPQPQPQPEPEPQPEPQPKKPEVKKPGKGLLDRIKDWADEITKEEC